jgi:hypothetical protein
MDGRVAEGGNIDPVALAAAIEREGFAAIPDFVGPEDLERMRAFVSRAVAGSGGEYVSFAGPDEVEGSGLDDLAYSPSFRSLMEKIYEAGTGRTAPSQPFYQILRCLAGEGSKRNSYLFHYDSYVITALVPIMVPSSGLSGDLLMLPNTRGIRSNYLFNVIDKLILDNKLSQIMLKQLTLKGLLPIKRIKMVPGTMYFFWGYRTIHTNEPCDPDKVRSTALFHYANPHKDVKVQSSKRALPHKGPAALANPIRVPVAGLNQSNVHAASTTARH